MPKAIYYYEKTGKQKSRNNNSNPFFGLTVAEDYITLIIKVDSDFFDYVCVAVNKKKVRTLAARDAKREGRLQKIREGGRGPVAAEEESGNFS